MWSELTKSYNFTKHLSKFIKQITKQHEITPYDKLENIQFNYEIKQNYFYNNN
jgi:hypothetical protein